MLELIKLFAASTDGQTAIFSAIAALILLFAKKILEPKSRVIWAEPHSFFFLVPKQDQPAQATDQTESEQVEDHAIDHAAPPPDQVDGNDSDRFPVRTRTIFVQNIGSEKATNVEVYLNYKPLHWEVVPVRTLNQQVSADQRFCISTPTLAPKEYFTIQLLDGNRELPGVMNVRWDEGVAKPVPMAPVRIYPSWANKIFATLMFLGIASIFYILFQIVLAMGSKI